MARFGRKKREEEPLEDQPQEEVGDVRGAEFVPEAALKPKSDVYTAMLILAFVVFLGGCILAGRELWEFYDVQFWVFTKP